MATVHGDGARVRGGTRVLSYDIHGRLSVTCGRMIGLLRQAADAGEHARLPVALVLLGTIAIAAFTASSAYDGWRAYQHVVISTIREVQNLASALAEQTAWSWSE